MSTAAAASYSIGLDIGGTKVAAGVVTNAGQLLHRVERPTPQTVDQAELLAVLGDVIDGLRQEEPRVAALGVGAAGMVDFPSGYIRWAPNNTYTRLPLRLLLEERTGLPTVVENDANAAAVAEAVYGAGSNCSNVITVTVGTGIGGGVVIDGRLLRGKSGHGAEVGHLLVNPSSNVRCGCGAKGCLEAMASGLALARMGRDAAQAAPSGLLAALAGAPDRVRGETVYEAARLGDATAQALFEQQAFWLGVGLASLVNLMDPEVIILAGGISARAGDIVLGPTRAVLAQHAFGSSLRELPPLVLAQLGADAGIVGAGTLALSGGRLHAGGSSGRVP